MEQVITPGVLGAQRYKMTNNYKEIELKGSQTDSFVRDSLFDILDCDTQHISGMHCSSVSRLYKKEVRTGDQEGGTFVKNKEEYLIAFHYPTSSWGKDFREKPVDRITLIPRGENEDVPDELVEKIKEKLEVKN